MTLDEMKKLHKTSASYIIATDAMELGFKYAQMKAAKEAENYWRGYVWIRRRILNMEVPTFEQIMDEVGL